MVVSVTSLAGRAATDPVVSVSAGANARPGVRPVEPVDTGFATGVAAVALRRAPEGEARPPRLVPGVRRAAVHVRAGGGRGRRLVQVARRGGIRLGRETVVEPAVHALRVLCAA